MSQTFPKYSFYFNKEMTGPEVYSFAGGEVQIFTASNPTTKKSNQDAVGIFELAPDRGVIAIADGVGGRPQGGKASQKVIRQIASSIKKANLNEDNLRAAILDGFENADQKLRKELPGSWSTLLVLEIQNQTIRSYQAGDSSVMIWGPSQNMKYRNVPQSPVGYAWASGVMSEHQCLLHPERNLVFNFVGTGETQIDIGPAIKLNSKDTVLAGSDGMFDNLYTKEIVARKKSKKQQPMLLPYISLCQKRMLQESESKPCHPDDLTAVAYRRAS